MLKYLEWFLGILITSLGLFFIIIYINLLRMGYSLLEFGKFISRSFECYFLVIGIIIIIISMERIKR